MKVNGLRPLKVNGLRPLNSGLRRNCAIRTECALGTLRALGTPIEERLRNRSRTRRFFPDTMRIGKPFRLWVAGRGLAVIQSWVTRF